ncbi:hypothetical protein FM106_26315 [Brachybacterium faecium]|nr:hypothetical protein FM106_26315 [Brachybacterium faecium]
MCHGVLFDELRMGGRLRRSGADGLARSRGGDYSHTLSKRFDAG